MKKLSSTDSILLKNGEIVERSVFSDKAWHNKPILIDYLKECWNMFQSDYTNANNCENCKYSILGVLCKKNDFIIYRYNVCRKHKPRKNDDSIEKDILWGAKKYEQYCKLKKIKIGEVK
jgi:hypothetical protein